MSNVIKARTTRLLPPEERKMFQEWLPDEEDILSDEAEHREAAAYQAAYDEVVAAAQEEVALLMEDARHKARALVDEAAGEAENIRETAREQGHRAGTEEGYREGFAHAGEELAELLRQGQAEVDAVLQKAYEIQGRQMSDMEPELYRLALSVAEKILGYELDQNNEAFVSIVRTAVDTMQCETRATLHVNAEQYIGAFRSRDSVRLKTGKGVVTAGVTVDPSVEPGGCLIETENNMADASPATQFAQIAQNLGIDL
ncbi:MAG: hypothetical protein LBR76_01570 [Oscillospiraceae bacterium]|nr:hypothetical protein [Oscillospiraceae bacterium]